MAKIRDFKLFDADMRRKSKQLKHEIDKKIPILVGEHLVDGFKESFDLQQFNDSGEQKWQEVKRREKSSSWYGFQYGTNSGGKKNFSTTATTRNILYGKGSSALRDSIFLKQASNRRVVIGSPLEHAQVHNEGLTAKVFGKTSFNMPQRKFMGTSKRLNRQSKKIIDIRINNVLG